jgi:hypothetical protein
MPTTISTAGLPALSTAEKTFKTAIETAIDAAGLVTMDAATASNDGYITKEFAALMVAATATNDGYLDKDDFATFTAKQTATLADGKIWVGNGSNVAAAVSLTGPIDLSNAGLTSFDAAWKFVTTTGTNGEVAISDMTTNGGCVVTPMESVAAPHAVAAAGKVTIYEAGTTNVYNAKKVAILVLSK